jgi:hypothetical protein
MAAAPVVAAALRASEADRDRCFEVMDFALPNPSPQLRSPSFPVNSDLH